MMLHTNVYYPEDKNPFGYCDDDVPEDINQETNHGCELKRRLSLNPFGSDLDSEDDENTVDDIPTSVSLNPFGSDCDTEEDIPSPGVFLPSSPPTISSALLRPIRPAPPPPPTPSSLIMKYPKKQKKTSNLVSVEASAQLCL